MRGRLYIAHMELGTMDFETLNKTIPYAKGGKEKVLRYSPYPNITIAMPGRHALQTDPVGGDFVVMVSDPIYNIADHQFKHKDIFDDISRRRLSSAYKTTDFMAFYLAVVNDGTDPLTQPFGTSGIGGVLEPQTFFCAVQCLAIAEHRRYAKYEPQFGGRYLPFRFAAGVAENLWEVNDCLAWEKKGRPGVEKLEKDFGIPTLTQELMGTGQ